MRIKKIFYQVRIKVTEDVSKAIRENKKTKVTQKIFDLVKKFDVRLVCTLDAFCDYCKEVEENGEDKGPLYKWTKDVIANPEKRAKHRKSFAFYRGNDQIYEKELANELFSDLGKLLKKNIIKDVKLHDNQLSSNPQPPNKYFAD